MTANDQTNNKKEFFRYDEFLEILPYISTNRIHWLIANLKLELKIREPKDDDSKKS